MIRGLEPFPGISRGSTFLGTTVLLVRKGDQVALGGDGQVTLGPTVVKHHARKIRKVYRNQVLAGFAGSVADAFTLFEKFESRLEAFRGNLRRASVELAKEWRTDRILRRLEALLAVADREHAFLISGTGDVLEPDDGIIAIGSGGPYALAAARALIQHTSLGARAVVEEALRITAGICIYTNHEIYVEEL